MYSCDLTSEALIRAAKNRATRTRATLEWRVSTVSASLDASTALEVLQCDNGQSPDQQRLRRIEVPEEKSTATDARLETVASATGSANGTIRELANRYTKIPSNINHLECARLSLPFNGNQTSSFPELTLKKPTPSFWANSNTVS